MLELDAPLPKEPSGFDTYEERLNSSPRWALLQGSMHFGKANEVFFALRRITKTLDEIGVPYALVGGLAMFHHGYRRFTADVDLLVSREGLKTIHERLEGHGYVPKVAGSKHLRDVENGVTIEFHVAGDFPGNGKLKPVAFPDPINVSEIIDGIRCISLPKLVELKLVSGSEPGRLKDLGDAQEMIRVLGLNRDFADNIDPSVRTRFDELWLDLQAAPPEE